MNLDQVKNDLKDIRYYYANKELFDKVSSTIGKNYVCSLVEKYNNAIMNAPPKLYDLYARKYVLNMTQESVANDTSYSMKTIASNCELLLNYLCCELNKEVKV